MDHFEIISRAYDAFNKRDIDAVLALFDKDVEWPNGWKGGYVHGHTEVRDYWTRQWKELDPTVTPVNFKELDVNQLQVEVKQTVKNLDGLIIADGMVIHTYNFNNGLIKKMVISA